MKTRLSNRRLFWICAFAAAAGVIAYSAYGRWQRERALPLHALTKDISVMAQIAPSSISLVRSRGFKTVIDLRPDGEAVDQPASKDIAAAAVQRGLTFYYLPVPHGPIPDETVDKLTAALAASPRPVLLYCRSGSRAARTWSLAEASRAGGADKQAILAAVKAAGLKADDLAAAIEARIARRR